MADENDPDLDLPWMLDPAVRENSQARPRLDPKNLFLLVVREAFADGAVSEAENDLLKRFAKVLKIDSDQAQKLATLAHKEWSDGKYQGGGEASMEGVFRKACRFAAVDGEIDAGERKLLESFGRGVGVDAAALAEILAEDLALAPAGGHSQLGAAAVATGEPVNVDPGLARTVAGGQAIPRPPGLASPEPAPLPTPAPEPSDIAVTTSAPIVDVASLATNVPPMESGERLIHDLLARELPESPTPTVEARIPTRVADPVDSEPAPSEAVVPEEAATQTPEVEAAEDLAIEVGAGGTEDFKLSIDVTLPDIDIDFDGF